MVGIGDMEDKDAEDREASEQTQPGDILSNKLEDVVKGIASTFSAIEKVMPPSRNGVSYFIRSNFPRPFNEHLISPVT